LKYWQVTRKGVIRFVFRCKFIFRYSRDKIFTCPAAHFCDATLAGFWFYHNSNSVSMPSHILHECERCTIRCY